MKWDFDKQHKNFTFALIFTTGANSIHWRYDLTEWETGDPFVRQSLVLTGLIQSK